MPNRLMILQVNQQGGFWWLLVAPPLRENHDTSSRYFHVRNDKERKKERKLYVAYLL